VRIQQDAYVKAFGELTHLGKGHRLRPLAHEVLRRFGVEAALLRQFHETINIVFRVTAGDGKRYVLRITPPWHFHGVEDVRSEIAWMRAIGDGAEIKLPTPLLTMDGEYVITATWPKIPGEWQCVLFSWIPGKLLAKRWTHEKIEHYGRLSAMLHAQGRLFAPTEQLRIRTYSSVFPHCNPSFRNPEPLVLLGGIDENLVPRAREDLLRRVHDRVQAEIDRLFNAAAPQPIHNDLHPWNVIVSRAHLCPIDFENWLMGFPIQDLGATLHYIQHHFSERIPFDTSLACFRRGYEDVQRWPEQRPGQIETMMAAHRLLLCNFYAASSDPEYREFAVGFLERMEHRLRSYLDCVCRAG